MEPSSRIAHAWSDAGPEAIDAPSCLEDRDELISSGPEKRKDGSGSGKGEQVDGREEEAEGGGYALADEPELRLEAEHEGGQ